MNPEERIRTMSGVSKRLFMALSDFRSDPPQLEDALFQLASVIDSTSKFHFPDEPFSKTRFTSYLDSVTTDVFKISTSGQVTMTDCTFLGRDGEQHTFGEVMYGIRCSSYHDPNEVDELLHWGEENSFGVKGGRFIVNQRLLTALFLILISDIANQDYIDRLLFNDDHFLVVSEKEHPFHKFIGRRDHLLDVLGLRK